MIEDITELRRAEEALRQSRERYASQRDAIIQLTGPLGHTDYDLASTFRQITEKDARTLGVARVSIWRYNSARTAIRCVDLFEIEANRHSSGMELSAADYPAYFRTLAAMDVIDVEDPRHDLRTSEFTESYLRPLDITSMLDAAIHVRGAVEGVLCHEHVGSPRSWHPDEQTFATAAANLVSLAIEEWQSRQAEAELRQSEERYRLLFENNPLPMWVYHLSTLRFLAVNESAVKHYGYTRAEFLAMTVKDLRPPEEIPAFLDSLPAAQTRDVSTAEWKHRKKDGSIIQVETVSHSMEFDGQPARLVLAQDITEKKLIEEKLLHTQRLESLGMLAAGIAHDLNNVLAPIVFAAPMLRGSLSTERDLKTLTTLERSADRGARLVRQILGFAHTSSGIFQVTQVKHLARDITDVIESTFPKSIRLEQQIPSDLWPVLGNATQIHQVIMNLCVNARDAMPSGGTLRLTVANHRLDAEQASALPGATPGAWLLIEVGDTGSGIPPEVLAHIWEPFFTTKAEGKGTGLGLSTVRGIVATHHGFVTLDTQPGHGSTFRVFLPAAEQPVVADLKPVSTHPVGHGELVLVVDDDLAVREAIALMLMQTGYRVLSAADGLEAVSHFNAHAAEIALVVTDIDMPHIDGFALGRILAQLQPNLPLLVMSGLIQDKAGCSSQPFTAEPGHHPYLQKPFTSDALLEAVARQLQPHKNP